MGMKLVTILTLSLLIIFFVFAGCESMEDMLGDAAKDLSSGSVSKSSSQSSSGSEEAGILDFKEGELLVAYEGSTWEDANYLVAKTLTAATTDTKNEGEFLYVNRGTSRWTPWFYESYIPQTEELDIGLKVFYCNNGKAHLGPMDRDSYRDSWWYIGRITETDDLFKGVVTINGDPYKLEAIRLPVEAFE